MDLMEWIEKQKDKDHKFTLQSLAKKLKIHPTTLSRTLSGMTKPNTSLSLEIEKVTLGSVKACEIVEDRSKHKFCSCGKYKN